MTVKTVYGTAKNTWAFPPTTPGNFTRTPGGSARSRHLSLGIAARELLFIPECGRSGSGEGQEQPLELRAVRVAGAVPVEPALLEAARDDLEPGPVERP